jgi:sugar lactone lactonase YvrE
MHIGICRKSIAVCLAAAAFATASAAQTPSFLPTVVTFAGNGTAGNTGNNGPATAAELNTLSGTTIDPAGNIYICDTNNNVNRKVDARTGIITIIAGTGVAGYTQDGVAANTSELNKPAAVRYYQGGLWIADASNNRIRRVDLTTGIITTPIGGGTGTVKNNLQSAAGNTLKIYPSDMGFDSLGNLYWSEGNGASRVNVYNIATGIAQIFAGTGGTTNGTGTNVGVATPTSKPPLTAPENTIMNGPFGIVVDAQNNVYVNETATGVIRKITVNGPNAPYETTYAGIGNGTGAAICAAATDSVGDGCPATTASSTVTTGVTGAKFASGSGTTLGHMSIDGNGTIYLADGTNGRVRMIPVNPSNPDIGGVVTTVGGTGVESVSASGGYPLNTTIDNPYDAQILPDGDLMISERGSNSVRLYHLPGTTAQVTIGGTPVTQTVNVLTQAGTGTFTLPNATDFTVGAPTCAPGVNVTGTVCTATVSFAPTLAGLRKNGLEFTDAKGAVVAGLSGVGLGPVASLLPGLAGTAAGTGTAGASGDAGAATAATFQTPAAVATDSLGNVYVADATANEVRKFAPNGTITRVAGTGTAGSGGDGAAATAATLSGPSGVAVDAAGNVYIADTGNNKIRMVSAVSGFISTVAGTGTAGYTGDQGTPAAATLNAPTQLAWSPLGILYVADTGNSVIRSIALNEQLITTVAGNGTANFDGDGGPGQAAKLSKPQSIALDGNGNLYIADTGNNRIRELSQGIITTLAGQTGSSFNGDGAAATATLGAPAGVAVDTAGNVYVADTMNQRIRVISSGQITTIMGTGTAAATGDGGTSNLATVSSPQALALDPVGNVYVADTGNHKIRSITVGGNTLVFKTQNPSEKSPAQTVTVYNSGNQSLSISSVTIPASGYLEQASPSGGVDCTSAPLTLTPGTSCNLNTVFNPPALGNYNGAITIADNSESVAAAKQTIQLQAVSALVYTATLTLPSVTTAGAALTGSLTIANPVTVYTRTMTFTSTDPQAVLPPNHTFTLADNAALTLSVTFKTAGPQCLTATDTVDPTVTSTACTNVSAAAASKIIVYTGNNQTANVGTAYTQRLVALVTDAYGNPVGNQPVAFTINPNGAASGSFTNGTVAYSTTADNTGYATAQAITSGPTIGTFTVTAALTGTSSTASFNLTIVIVGTFTIIPASAQVGPIPPGTSNLDPLTIVGAGGFTAPIIFTCTAPAGITCAVGPSPFLIANQSNAPASLNFTSQGSLLGSVSGFSSPWSALVALIVGGLLLRRRRKLGAIVVAALAFFAINALSGCGQYYAPITPNGTYTVTVTGTAQTASASTTITYTVQK